MAKERGQTMGQFFKNLQQWVNWKLARKAKIGTLPEGASYYRKNGEEYLKMAGNRHMLLNELTRDPFTNGERPTEVFDPDEEVAIV
jgi:hypothetical protein